VPGLTLPGVAEEAGHVWHLFTVRHARRDALQAALAAEGIGTLIHYPVPPHLSQAYAAAGHARGAFPLAERIAETILSLPLGPWLKDAQIERTAAVVRRFGAGEGSATA
jgi:dTDP-4-amino-4,6-dideoxygalactose transaminase